MSVILYNAALVLHIAGISLAAGTSFIDYITFRAFYAQYAIDEGKGLVLKKHLSSLQQFLSIGMLLILISGITMMVRLHEVWGAQLWFRIKMGVLVLIIFNGLLRKTWGKKLEKMFLDGSPAVGADGQRSAVKRNIISVQLIQLLLFLIIFSLSVFKFN